MKKFLFITSLMLLSQASAMKRKNEEEVTRNVKPKIKLEDDNNIINNLIELGGDQATASAESALKSLTPLMEAAADGNLFRLNLELSKPVDINQKDKYGNTALHLAAQNNQYHAILTLLFKPSQIQIDAQDNDGLTPLAIAVSNGNFFSARFLLVLKADVEKRDNRLGYTPLMRAASSGNEDIVKLLLDFQANPTIGASKGEKIVSVLDLASDNKDIFDLLQIKKKEFTERALIFMADCKDFFGGKWQGLGNMGLIWINHIDINAFDDKNNTPLIWACKKGFSDIIKKLIELKSDVNAKNDRGYSALHCSSAKNEKEIAKYLIEKKADVNAIDNQGHTALYNILEKGFYKGHVLTDMAKLLVDCKADINFMVYSEYANGMPPRFPLEIAVRKQYKVLVNKLIEANAAANVILKDFNGFTYSLLHLALARNITKSNRKNLYQIIEMLIDAKADVNAKDSSGQTPLMIAAKKQNKTIIDILVQAGAKYGRLIKK